MAVSISNTDTLSTTADAATYNATNVDFGAGGGASKKSIVVSFQTVADSQGTQGVSSASIESESASVLATSKQGSSSFEDICGAFAKDEDATTGEFSITFDETCGGIALSVYRLLDADIETLNDTATAVHSSGVIELDVNVDVDGAWVGGTTGSGNGTTTWSEGTEVQDFELFSSPSAYGSSAFGSNSGTPLAIDATNSDSTPTTYCGYTVSFSERASGDGDGSASGSASVSGVGQKVRDADGSSAGTSSVSGSSSAASDADGTAAGTATVSGVGEGQIEGDATGTSSGAATVTGDSQSFADMDGSAAGTSTVTAETGDTTGTTAGTSTAQAFSKSKRAAAGTSAGVATVTAVAVPTNAAGEIRVNAVYVDGEAFAANYISQNRFGGKYISGESLTGRLRVA